MHDDYIYSPPLYNAALEPYLRGMNVPRACLKEITYKYMEPHRFYHDWKHPNNMASIALGTYRQVDTSVITNDEFQGLQFALLFHDIKFSVDDAQEKNKLNSANEMLATLQTYNINLSKITVEVARACIMRTGNHLAFPNVGHPNVRTIEFFRDMDLVYLGEESYEAFVQHIRGFELEWAQAANEDDTTTISHMYLSAFKQARNIYNTPIFSAMCEAKARANIDRYLTT